MLGKMTTGPSGGGHQLGNSGRILGPGIRVYEPSSQKKAPWRRESIWVGVKNSVPAEPLKASR